MISEEKERIVYHYTDLNALIHILGKSKISLRATSSLYLNDRKEIIEGIESVKRVTGKNINPDDFRDMFITSFSQAEDKLSMWGMYAANGSGCAIGLDINKVVQSYRGYIECTYGEESSDEMLRTRMQLYQNGHMTYIPYDSNEKGWTKKAELTEDILIDLCVSTCLGTKNIAFEEEKEIRCIKHQEDNIEFKVKNGVVIPYITVPVSKTALKSIIIGPTANSDITERSIRHLLLFNGYDLNNVDIIHSQIPYRG